MCVYGVNKDDHVPWTNENLSGSAYRILLSRCSEGILTEHCQGCVFGSKGFKLIESCQRSLEYPLPCNYIF